MTSPMVLTPNEGPSLCGNASSGNASFEPLYSVTIGATVRAGRVVKKTKDRTTKNKSQKSYISPIYGSPHWNDLIQKLHGGWYPRGHVCQVSNWNLQGLWFYMGLNFRFSYWFLAQAEACDYNVQLQLIWATELWDLSTMLQHAYVSLWAWVLSLSQRLHPHASV